LAVEDDDDDWRIEGRETISSRERGNRREDRGEKKAKKKAQKKRALNVPSSSYQYDV